MALGDLDGDGDLDAFVGNTAVSNKVWFNDGTGLFTESGQDFGNADTFSVALGDIDNDGDLDAVCANINGVFVQPAPNTVYLNDGSGFFTDSMQRLNNDSSLSVALGDADGDNDLDAFLGSESETRFNNGTGTFADSGQNLGSFFSAGVALGDLDGDGDLDAFVANHDSSSGPQNKVYTNNGSGIFTDAGLALGNVASINVALGDLDGDGDLDAFVVNDLNSPNKVWLNNTTPTLIELSTFIATPGSHNVTLTWETDSEIDNAGFNIYRAMGDGDYRKINGALIPAEGSPTWGASYSFTDTAVQNRKTYHYTLEDVDLNGVSTMHGPVSATPRLIYGFGK